MATVKTLNKIRELIENNVGRKVVITTDKGRNKIRENKGILLKTYSSLFIVEIQDARSRKLSFSYSDVLTEKVVIKTLYDNEYIAIT